MWDLLALVILLLSACIFQTRSAHLVWFSSIFKVISLCTDANPENGCSFEGVPNISAYTNACACGPLCRENFLCTHFYWVPDDVDKYLGLCQMMVFPKNQEPAKQKNDKAMCGSIPNKKTWKMVENDILYAKGCEFSPNGYLRYTETPENSCGQTCRDHQECTHFHWQKFHDTTDGGKGNCFLKQISAETVPEGSYDYTTVCGFVRDRVNNTRLDYECAASTSPCALPVPCSTESESSPILWTVAFAEGVLLFGVLVNLLWVLRRQYNTEDAIGPEEFSEMMLLFSEKGRREKPRAIPPEICTIDRSEKLGSGHFGQVFKGTLNISTTVAVKVHQNTGDKENLYKEAETLSKIGIHPNVLLVLGISVDAKNEPCLVTEYCENGNLLDFLKRNRKAGWDNILENGYSNRPGGKPLSTSDLLSFALQIALGMNHIAAVPCLHLDLAARNVLLTANMTCRVADFGLSRDQAYYRKTNSNDELPYEWMSIEAMENLQFSEKSDVWSFGILLYELFTCGQRPFSGYSYEHLLGALKNGKRPSKPEKCPDAIYNLMRMCWQKDPKNRPSFVKCCLLLCRITKADRSLELSEVRSRLRSELNNQEKLLKQIFAE